MSSSASRPDGDGTDDPPLRLMFVCTGNRCRSPMAEVLAAEVLARRGVDARVDSCGVLEAGVPVSVGSVKAVARRGLDLRGRLSQQIDAPLLVDTDLIVTMERRHLLAVAEIDLAAVDRSFTLVELADLADSVGPRSQSQSVAEWIAAANRHRHPQAVLATGTDDDVPDPMGQSRRAYRRTATLIDELLHRVVDRMYPVDSPS